MFAQSVVSFHTQLNFSTAEYRQRQQHTAFRRRTI